MSHYSVTPCHEVHLYEVTWKKLGGVFCNSDTSMITVEISEETLEKNARQTNSEQNRIMLL